MRHSAVGRADVVDGAIARYGQEPGTQRAALAIEGLRPGPDEDFEHGVAHIAAHESVDAAAHGVVRRFILVPAAARVDSSGEGRKNAGAAGLQVELSADFEHGVADGFAFEAMAVVAPHELVFGIDLGCFLAIFRGLLIGVREHDEAVHFLDAPTVLDEGGGEVIEQLLVGGSFAHHAEIAGAADDAAAETTIPDAVGHDARGERIGRVARRFGERAAAASRDRRAA